MRAVVQRVTRAQVKLSSGVCRRIGTGVLILLAVTQTDQDEQLEWLVQKIVHLRIFDDKAGVMNLSLLQQGGQALVVSQFTLYGDTRRGNRPSYTRSAPPDIAVPLYERFLSRLQELGIAVQSGEFGDMMEVELLNSGPVTILLDSDHQGRNQSPF
ncbi:MAG: D-tyrosyl-tRNA(Tyr) deacylase [Candidatus Delongbacteria bacterium]|nr:D-tyrosyl-tRNA(Tyr) deacylase [bacterium]MBL7033095.1 D-tyrosyl-tRNA(Tyr) deacylase [Candidatus Delongbacteria bacterium]